MTDQPRLRLSDAERQQAAEALGEHFAAGRLDADEHEERSSVLWQARFADDLRPLFGDLPGPHPALLGGAPGAAGTPYGSVDWNARRATDARASRQARRARRARGPRGPLAALAALPTLIAVVLVVVLGMAAFAVVTSLLPVLLVGGLIFLLVRRSGHHPSWSSRGCGGRGR